MTTSPSHPLECEKLYPLAQLIEGYRARPPLSDETLCRIGGLVLAGQAVSGPNIDVGGAICLDDEQHNVVVHAAEGDTTQAAAQKLGWEEDKVVELREQLLAIYRVPAMSAVINLKIRNGTLPVMVKGAPDKRRRLDTKQELVCEAICVGITNNKIGGALGLSKRETAIRVMAPLVHALEANGRTNCVYQSYALGFREIPSRKTVS